MKNYEVEIMGTTYRTYTIKAENEDKALELAFKSVDEDWEVPKQWKASAELSYIDEVEITGGVNIRK
jgi:hypothetical protein